MTQLLLLSKTKSRFIYVLEQNFEFELQALNNFQTPCFNILVYAYCLKRISNHFNGNNDCKDEPLSFYFHFFSFSNLFIFFVWSFWTQYNQKQEYQKRAMSQLINASFDQSQIVHTLTETMQAIFRTFTLFLKSSCIDFAIHQKECDSTLLSTVLTLFIPFRHTKVEVLCKILVKWSKDLEFLTFDISFKIHKLDGKPFLELGNRTRLEFLSSIGEVNKYLQQKKSCLSLSSQFDSLMMGTNVSVAACTRKGKVKQIVGKMIKDAVMEFLKYFKELNEVQFFQDGPKSTKSSSLRQILQTLYVNKTRLFIHDSKKHQITIKNCLSFMIKATNRHNREFRSLEQSNATLAKTFSHVESNLEVNEQIANAIEIHTQQEPFVSQSHKFQKNLQTNKSVVINEGIVTLKNVRFSPRRSFGPLRQAIQNEIIYRLPQSPLIVTQQHLVYKKFIDNSLNFSSQNSTASLEDNSGRMKSQLSHENEHNFIMVNGNLKSPFIGKYYLNINESHKEIKKRTIMTRFEKGDLFTEVAYKTHYGRRQFRMVEYLTMFEQLAQAISFLHQNMILHRDIKPTNILFQYHANNRFTCKLIDFGSCFVRRSEYRHLFSSKVCTTPRFNLTYRQALTESKNVISQDFNQRTYDTHELFDIYGIGETISYLLQYSTQRFSFQALNTVFNICKNINPHFRFTPQQLIIIIRHLKLTLMYNDPLVKLYSGFKTTPQYN